MKTPRILAKRLAPVALMAILAAAAVAQGPGGPGGPPPGGRRGPGRGGPMALDKLPPMLHLASRPEVADELGLTDDQRDAIDNLEQSSRPQRPQPGEGGRPDRADRDRADAAADAKLRSILSAAQADRLDEIRVQSMGLAAALVPAVQDRLGLSDAQKTRLRALVPADRGPGNGGPGGGPGGSPPDGGDFGGPPDGGRGQGGPPQGGPGGRGGPGGMDPRRQQLESKIAALLTDAQKAALKALGGKPFRMQGPNGG